MDAGGVIFFALLFETSAGERVEFVFDQLRFIFVKGCSFTQQLVQGYMLVKCGAGGILVLQYVTKAWTESDLASSVEANLGGCDVGVSDSVFMQVVHCF